MTRGAKQKRSPFEAGDETEDAHLFGLINAALHAGEGNHMVSAAHLFMGEMKHRLLKRYVFKTNYLRAVALVYFKRQIDDLRRIDSLSRDVLNKPVFILVYRNHYERSVVCRCGFAYSRIDEGKAVSVFWNLVVIAEPGLLKNLLAFGDNFVLVLVRKYVRALVAPGLFKKLVGEARGE